MTPVWALALATAVAALTAALGAVPLRIRRTLPLSWLGWSNASAAGLMLGGAFVLAREGLGLNPLPAALGAGAGVAVLLWSHWFAGTSELDLNRIESVDATYAPRVLLVQTLHGAFEGMAIGAAAVFDLKLGLFLALALAVHNVAEAMTLCAVLCGQGIQISRAATLAVISNLGQVLLAVVTYSLVVPAPELRAPVLGFATGALVYLVLVDLLPEAYEQSGETSIAVVTSLTTSVVILLGGLLRL